MNQEIDLYDKSEIFLDWLVKKNPEWDYHGEIDVNDDIILDNDPYNDIWRDKRLTITYLFGIGDRKDYTNPFDKGSGVTFITVSESGLSISANGESIIPYKEIAYYQNAWKAYI